MVRGRRGTAGICVERRIDARAQAGIDARREVREEAFEISLVFERADLNRDRSAAAGCSSKRMARRYSKRAFTRSSGLRMKGRARPMDWK